MKATTMIEILDAAHLAHFVESPFQSRGGLLLIGPPGVLKTTLVRCAVSDYPDARGLSDINVQQLMVMKDDIAGGKYNTLAFYALEKLYQRHSSTAANVEGTIQAFVEEGFTSASFEDQRRQTIVARCMVVGAMTESLHRKKFTEWMDSGFARRFLHCLYRLENNSALMDSVEKWQPLIMDGITRKWPSNRIIPRAKISPEETQMIRRSLRFQPGETTPYQLLLKIYSVLRWKYPQAKARSIYMDFSQCLTQNGAIMTL